MMMDENVTEAAVAAGTCRCGCGGRLRKWGSARPVQIRQLGGEIVSVHRRRTICESCRRTHVMQPAAVLRRRRDAVESVGAALVGAAAGLGHRTIAAELGLPDSTVRNWLRRVRNGAGWLYGRAVCVGHELEPDQPRAVPRASRLAEAIDALGFAASAAVRRLGLVGSSPWRIIAMITGGLLLGPHPGG